MIIELIIKILNLIKDYFTTKNTEDNGTITDEKPQEVVIPISEEKPQVPQYPQNYINITSGWGNRTYTLNGQTIKDFHYGIDFGGNQTKVGDRIRAILDGRVIALYTDNTGATTMIIRHTEGSAGKSMCWLSKYVHWVNPRIKIGDIVKENDWIADEGGEGKYCTAPHLHLELWRSYDYRTDKEILDLGRTKMALNPLPYLRIKSHQVILDKTKFLNDIKKI